MEYLYRGMLKILTFNKSHINNCNSFLRILSFKKNCIVRLENNLEKRCHSSRRIHFSSCSIIKLRSFQIFNLNYHFSLREIEIRNIPQIHIYLYSWNEIHWISRSSKNLQTIRRRSNRSCNRIKHKKKKEERQTKK